MAQKSGPMEQQQRSLGPAKQPGNTLGNSHMALKQKISADHMKSTAVCDNNFGPNHGSIDLVSTINQQQSDGNREEALIHGPSSVGNNRMDEGHLGNPYSDFYSDSSMEQAL